MHRLKKPIWTFAAEGGGEGGEAGAEGGSGGSTEGQEGKEQTFTQADVDKLVGKARGEERRKASEKFADYDDLKTKAEGAKSLEDRIADLEGKGKASEHRALRAEVANAKGLTAGQAKRLVGDTREELEADADELLEDIAARESERKKQGNRVPREGHTSNPKADQEREAVRSLFGTG